ncbi:hypothetical protein BANRA_00472 [Acinetobacter baumannii]|nr:hypothetical protein BANRA_00472 [Acinetobacter baumannii]
MAQEARLVIVIDSERAKRTAQDLSVELDSITKKGFRLEIYGQLVCSHQSFSWTHGWFINSKFCHFKDGYIYWTTKPS